MVVMRDDGLPHLAINELELAHIFGNLKVG
jgi:hypothetical protein